MRSALAPTEHSTTPAHVKQTIIHDNFITVVRHRHTYTHIHTSCTHTTHAPLLICHTSDQLYRLGRAVVEWSVSILVLGSKVGTLTHQQAGDGKQTGIGSILVDVKLPCNLVQGMEDECILQAHQGRESKPVVPC